MGIVIRLLRHIPAYVLLTYTDERNAKMFHGLQRFLRRPVAKLACRGSQLYTVNGASVFASFFGSGGAADVPELGVARAWNSRLENASCLRLQSHFGFRPPCDFLL